MWLIHVDGDVGKLYMVSSSNLVAKQRKHTSEATLRLWEARQKNFYRHQVTVAVQGLKRAPGFAAAPVGFDSAVEAFPMHNPVRLRHDEVDAFADGLISVVAKECFSALAPALNDALCINMDQREAIYVDKAGQSLTLW